MTDARPRLQSLIFEVTQQCNHACQHCYNTWQGDGDYPRGQLDTERTLSLLAKALDETRCNHVTLTGGEPLLRKDLAAMLEFLGRRKVQVTIISNGHLLDAHTTTALVTQGVSLFELPLLSHQREIHDRLSGCPGAWDAVLAAMANIRLNHGAFVAAFVATRQNISHLAETIRLAFAFGARGLMLNRFNPGGRGRGNLRELMPSVEDIGQALATAEEAVEELGLPISCSIPIQPCLVDLRQFPHLGFGFCAAGSEQAYYTLDPVGNLRPCNHSATILGNLFEEPFADLVAPERISPFTSAIPPFCTNCPRRQECQGGCKAAAQVCYGSLQVEEPFLREGIQAGAAIRPGS